MGYFADALNNFRGGYNSPDNQTDESMDDSSIPPVEPQGEEPQAQPQAQPQDQAAADPNSMGYRLGSGVRGIRDTVAGGAQSLGRSMSDFAGNIRSGARQQLVNFAHGFLGKGDFYDKMPQEQYAAQPLMTRAGQRFRNTVSRDNPEVEERMARRHGRLPGHTMSWRNREKAASRIAKYPETIANADEDTTGGQDEARAMLQGRANKEDYRRATRALWDRNRVEGPFNSRSQDELFNRMRGPLGDLKDQYDMNKQRLARIYGVNMNSPMQKLARKYKNNQGGDNRYAGLPDNMVKRYNSYYDPRGGEQYPEVGNRPANSGFDRYGRTVKNYGYKRPKGVTRGIRP